MFDDLIEQNKVAEVRHLLATKLMIANDSNQMGQYPLHIAAYNGHLEMCQVLFDAGARVNVITGPGAKTPLHLAAANGHFDVCKFLIDKGVDIYAKDWNGNNALVLAANSGHTKIKDLIFKTHMIRTSQAMDERD